MVKLDDIQQLKQRDYRKPAVKLMSQVHISIKIQKHMGEPTVDWKRVL